MHSVVNLVWPSQVDGAERPPSFTTCRPWDRASHGPSTTASWDTAWSY